MQLDDMSPAQRAELDATMSQPSPRNTSAKVWESVVADRERKSEGFLLTSPPSPTPSAADLLAEGQDILVQRGKQYDAQKTGERGMSKVVTAFNALEGTALTEEQGWRFMVMLKLMRASQGAPHKDNYVDGANYFALAGEAALKEAQGG